MERDAPSPKPMVYSHIYICQNPPGKEPSHEMGLKHTVTIHRAPHRQKAYIQWGAAWSPKGIVMTLLSQPQNHAAFSTIPFTLAWIDQCPVIQHVL